MDHRSANDRDTEVDLESGLPLIGDDSKRVSIPSSAKQGKALFAKVSEGFVRGSVKGMSSGKSPVGGFQGSPLSTGGSDGGLISVEYQLNPSASDTNAPHSESHK
ncbi:hypothetical protein Fmac_009580 [Flemingia macrophylla]|uniref:Uncharacterized protein n=1 Tax=Flemingia macrophylla TaxID=520843 RepID=A0ABD1N0N1_9FABA